MASKPKGKQKIYNNLMNMWFWEVYEEIPLNHWIDWLIANEIKYIQQGINNGT